ncbi:hypothetical protein ACIHEJ_33025 [Streptomyces sp. NPDC052301]|uniref:hypothetical protein n=1 Tax=Streptomyces sp. NPDC052301 TaxID=3365687 RepID=UPI0037D95C47
MASAPTDVELTEGQPELERLIAEVEGTGERVRLTRDGEPARVLLPRPSRQYWSTGPHFHHEGARPEDEPAQEYPPGPTAYGPCTGYNHPHVAEFLARQAPVGGEHDR